MTGPSTLSEAPSRLRDDLTFVRQGSGERRICIVKNPATRKFFRLGEVEEFIARQFDGVTSLADIRRRTERRFNALLPGPAIATFARNLSRAGLLAGGGAKPKAARKPFVHGSLLRIQFRAMDPDGLLGRIEPRIRWAFTPAFVAGALALILLAAYIVASSWSEIRPEFAALLRFTAIPLVLVVIFSVISAHEFGHGLACKHFGGEVHEMGFMLMYFQPALYCDVSDAWLIPERARRVWVSVAGPFVELTVWALAAIGWRVTEPGGLIHDACLIVMATSGLHTLLNFNPFVKLDGYYILSDLLGIPNLRRRSFAHVGSAVKRAFGLFAPADERLTRGESWICAIYGTVASAGTFALIAFILLTAGSYLVDGKQPVVILLSTAAVGLRFQRRFSRLFGAKNGRDPDEDGDDDDAYSDRLAEWPTGDAEPDHVPPPAPTMGVPEEETAETTRTSEPARTAAPAAKPAAAPAAKPAAAAAPESPPAAASEPPLAPKHPDDRAERKRREHRARMQRRAMWAALAASVVLLILFGHSELRVAGAFTILPEHNADVRTEVDGLVSDVLIKEGQRVNAGDIVVRLSAREPKAQLQSLNADLERANARLRLLRVGTSKDSIELARASVTRAQSSLQYAQTRADRVKQLADGKFATKSELESAQEAADDARNSLTEAQKRLQVLTAGSRPEEVTAAQAEVDRITAQRGLLSSQLQNIEVRTPTSGIVATPERQLHDLRGQLVQRGALLAKVFELRTVTVEITLAEKDIGDVKPGYPVFVRARAYPGLTFSGHVVSIAAAMQGAAVPLKDDAPPAATSSATTIKTILVTTEIENPDGLLKPGMSGEAKILCGDRPIRDLAVRRILRTLNLQVWSWW